MGNKSNFLVAELNKLKCLLLCNGIQTIGGGGGLLRTPLSVTEGSNVSLAARSRGLSGLLLIIPALWKFWKTSENGGMVLGRGGGVVEPPLLRSFMFSLNVPKLNFPSEALGTGINRFGAGEQRSFTHQRVLVWAVVLYFPGNSAKTARGPRIRAHSLEDASRPSQSLLMSACERDR